MSNDQAIKTAPIVVESGVVKHLSLGLYRNFALAIKELISNAYDAGATEVKLKLDLENGRIIIRDNGQGMTETEFKEQYLHIGYFKEPSKDLDELGRMRIGTFGIGFLAPLPYCKRLKIITKKKGQGAVLEGDIHAEDFFTQGNWDIKDAKVKYRVYESDLPDEEGETIIVLDDIKDQIHDELRRETGVRRTIEGSGYNKFKWTLSQYCPIEFPLENEDLRSFFKVNGRIPMKLWLDGERLYRNVPKKAKILEKEIKNFGEIELKYVIMTPYETVKPQEMRGFQVRLKDVAIGFPQDFDVTKLGRVLGKLNWLCGEVHISKGLDNALLVNRDSFNFTEDVSTMYEFFRKKLTQWNEKVEGRAQDDKGLYLALGELREDDRIVEDLTKSNLVHVSKERLRLSEGTLRKSKGQTVEDPVDRVVEALTKQIKDSKKVVRKKGQVSPETAAIQIEEKSNIITVYENHPAFLETIEFHGEVFQVKYDEWNPSETPFSICKLTNDRNGVIYNKRHPLFKGKLNDSIVRRLGLGILLILSELENSETMIGKFNQLVKETFEG